MQGLWLAVLSFLVGSIPFGYLVGRICGRIDVRQHGSRNIGATNVSRLLGFRYGLLVLLLDLLKGLLPTLLLPQWLGLTGGAGALPAGAVGGEWEGANWRALAGLAAILGHMFPPALAFRGGKGVATALGVVLSLAPRACGVAGAVFLLSMLVWRYVSLSSILAAVAFAVVQLWLIPPGQWSRETAGVLLFSLLVPALITWRHRANLGRLWAGTESRFTFRKPPPPDQSPGATPAA